MKSITALTICALAITSLSSLADNSRPDSHAPINIMGDHTHKAGEWMLSYRFMDMKMSDNYIDSDDVSSQDVLEDYMVAPLEMTMRMHMLGVMYAPSDKVTLMAMTHYLDNDMNHLTRMGMTFSTDTSGLGDTSVSALVNIQQDSSSSTHYQVGISFSTGDIKERGNTPMGNVRLPYPMQLGSGTYDAILALTHKEYFANSSWGIQGKQIIRTGHNDLDYRLGNRFELNSWYAYNLNHQWATSAGIRYLNQKDIKGADSALNPMMVPTADPKLRSGYAWDLSLGLNFNLHNGHRLGFEFTKTVHQDLDGPQLGRDWSATLGWQYAL
ncbi:transporter [Kangiella sp. TOML190]|uniref:transporter n=1 Tax=Kangiella sp. TOML190 TaxID=2931351 RepID=UPI00203C39E2|nr:transporter [Kangiella sp. TOML190]